MKANITLGQRISLGFALLLLITSIIGGIAAWQMRSAANGAVFLSVAVAPQANLTSRLSEASAATQLSVRTYSLTGDEAQYKLAEKHLAEVQADLDACRKLSVDQPSLVALAEGIKEADTALAAYREGVTATVANQKELIRVRQDLDTSAGQFVAEMESYSKDQNKNFDEEMKAGAAMAKLEERRIKLMNAADIEDLGNGIRITNYKSQALREPELIEKILPNFAKIRSLIDQTLAVTHQEKNIEQLKKVRAAVDAYEGGIKAVMQNYLASRAIGERRAKAAAEFDAVVHNVLERSITRTSGYATESATDLTRSASLTIWGLVGAIIAGVVASVLIVRGLVKVLTATSETLAQGTLQISAATGQVSSASQTLAEGASEQAASLEEISSSLEELSSTTKHNAENATSAKQVADRARVAAEHGAEEMEKMDKAMTGIRDSSNEISKIIKTIDEIAFQTNILALNAAVEAARAGEAGAGFAVVADEVRTLAQRCATAARETTEKISDATTRSELGANLTRSVAASLQEIVTQAREVDRLVADVANASREQSTGLEQVNIAVGQMDKVTQGNAASAEETASAAEEMNAQTQELQHSAEELAALVGLNLAAHAAEVNRTVKPAVVKSNPVVQSTNLLRPAAVVHKPALKQPRIERKAVEADAHFV